MPVVKKSYYDRAAMSVHVPPHPAARAGQPAPHTPRHVRVAIVGAGFSGLGLAIRLKQHGIDSFVLLERADDIGGTWRDNIYPGCACDVPANLYSFSFAPNPQWSHIYARQPEIWTYLRRCVRRFGLQDHIHFGHEVRNASWDDEQGQWRIDTTGGELTADILALGNGPLSEPALPAIPGLERFGGTVFHSAQWDHGHDLSGERVAVIGTGASAIQFVPQIQPRVGHLSLFQRTPPWIIPRGDRCLSEREKLLYRALPIAQYLERAKIYWRNELTVVGLVYQPDKMKAAEKLAQRHLEAQVADPELRAKLTPTYRLGCKRILLSDDFYPALTRDNVELVTERIREVRAGSIVTEDGAEHAVDTIILATGFHVTDNPSYRRLHGRDGRSLAEVWSSGPQAYLGTTVAGFPNLFLLSGPNTNLGHNSIIFMIECQVNYIVRCIRELARAGLRWLDVRREAMTRFNAVLGRRLDATVWAGGCTSWYKTSSGKITNNWPGFSVDYWRRTRRPNFADFVRRR